jgi:hypothetical protein
VFTDSASFRVVDKVAGTLSIIPDKNPFLTAGIKLLWILDGGVTCGTEDLHSSHIWFLPSHDSIGDIFKTLRVTPVPDMGSSQDSIRP